MPGVPGRNGQAKKGGAGAKPGGGGATPEDRLAIDQHRAPYRGAADHLFTASDAAAGYPKTLERLRAYPDAKLRAERHDHRFAVADRAFGGNARSYVSLIDRVMAERKRFDISVG